MGFFNSNSISGNLLLKLKDMLVRSHAVLRHCSQLNRLNLENLTPMFKLLLTSLALVFASTILAQTTPVIEWQRSLGGSAAELARDILTTPDGGSLIVGDSQSNNGDASGNHGYNDFWVVKQDYNGDVQWQRMYGGSGYDHATSVAPVMGGGFVITGGTTSHDGDVGGLDGGNFSDIWVIRIDDLGNLIWQMRFGSSTSDTGSGIQQTTDGGFLLLAEASTNDGDIEGNHGYADFWLAKLDSSGELLWQRSFGGSDTDAPFALSLTADGGSILAGYTLSDDGDVTGFHPGSFTGDGWVVKVDSVGDLQWQKALGGSGDDYLLSVIQSEDGGYILTGWTESADGDVTGTHGESDMWVVKLDEGGDLLWQKALGGSGIDAGSSVERTNDGGFIVAGYTNSVDGDVSFNHGNFDGWVVKLDSLGNMLWEKTMGGSLGDSFYSIRLTNDNGFLVAGESYSNDGDVSGHHGDKDAWVVKLGPDPSGISELHAAIALSVFPNPTEHFVSIQCELKAAGKVRLEIWNAAGQLLRTPIQERASPGMHSWNFDASVLAAGVYQLRFTTNEGSATRSLVKVE